MSGSSNGASQGSAPRDGVPLDDPRSLLRVYPFATYTPTARVAEHFSPHTRTFQSAPGPSALYPQHSDQFDRFDRPQSEQDWAMRKAGQQRLRFMLEQSQRNGNTYSHLAYPPAVDSSDIDAPSQHLSDIPMAYSFLPPADNHDCRDPPTPVSLPSPSSTINANDFFETYVDDTLRRSPQGVTPPRPRQPAIPATASTQTTPSIARTLASTSLAQDELESPDPLAMPGPSPSKKARLNGRTSPVRTHSGLKIKLKVGNASSSLNTLAVEHPIVRKLTPEVVIDVNRKSASPRKARVEDPESSGDELDWGDQEVMDQDGDYRMSDPTFTSPSPTKRIEPKGSGRTGERDQRSHFQKLQTLLEDIFEESDSFPAEVSTEDLQSTKYFSHTSRTGSHPLLSYRVMDKMIDYMARLKGKRRAESPAWDLEAFTRVLSLLERSMREGEEFAVFDEVKRVEKKPKLVKGKKNSGSPELNVDELINEEDELSAERIVALEGDLQRVANAGIAAAGVLTLLDLEGFPKQMYSEDLLSLAVALTKDQMTKVIFPVVSCLGGDKSSSAFLNRVVAAETFSSKGSNTTSTFSHPLLSSILRSTLIALPRITSLISRTDMSFSDSLVIQTVYLSISPLFLPESATAPKKKGKEKAANANQIASLMKTFRMESMGCLRATFARYDSQRHWIIEEILTSIVKIPDQTGPRMRFPLANGSSIHTMSALLLQLLQASAYGAVAKVRALRSTVLEAEIMGAEGKEKMDVAREEARVCTEAIDSVFSSAKMIATFLVTRSGTSKTNKTSIDTDYKMVLETLVGDLLTVLYRPEWPAASLFLSVISRLMMNAVEDPKSGADNSAAKSIALDHLGDIAARIRALHAQMSNQSVPTFEEIISKADSEGARLLLQAHKLVDSCLLASAETDDMYSCARDMTCVVYAQELHTVIQKVDSVIGKLAAEKDEDAVAEREKLQLISQTLKSASRDVWQADDRLFETKDPRQSENALQASIALARGRPLQSAFEPILRAISLSMESPVVALRSKALRALGSIVTVDPDVLAMPSVKLALEDRLADGSPAVRDIAVDLVGKYIVQKPMLAMEYYRHIADRIDDSGLGVRKRVMKLLTAIFSTVTDSAIRTDICCRLIDSMNDSDDAVKALATKSLAELLYPAAGSESRSSLLTEIVSEYHGHHRLLESAVQKISAEITDGPTRYRATVEELVSQLIDATEQPDFDALGHVKAIYLLCASDPGLIDTGKASVLLSYLRTPIRNPDEQATNDMLLKIFRRSIPAMPRVTSTFATELVSKLAPMVNKPSGGFANLRELISCLCVAVSHLTRDFAPITKMLRACDSRLKTLRQQYTEAPPANTTSTGLFLYITALIVEHVNLDKLAVDDDDVQRDIRLITELQLHEYFFDLYLHFSHYTIFQNAPSLALGSLFQAYPLLILRDEAVEWMQRVFNSPDLDAQARLFKVIFEFLEAEAERKASGKMNKDMAALIGANQGVSESGVSTAVVQRNIGAILAGSKSAHPALQDSALSVLEFTVRQGLYHPIECMPILIALETSELASVADKALALHTHLHVKHASLVNVRYLEYAKASFEYQRTITSEVSGHRHGEALLQGWYSLISEKRAWRIDLLRSFIRAFDFDVAKNDTVDIGLVLYLSDILATLEYKLQDEPMSVVHYMGIVIASSVHLASMLESGAIEGDPQDPIAGKKLVIPNSEEVVSAEVAINASIVVCLALATKNHLLSTWGLSEDKCLKHTPGKKSSAGDKPATRKHVSGLDLSRIPLVRGVQTVAEFRSQTATFLQLLKEDGSI